MEDKMKKAGAIVLAAIVGGVAGAGIYSQNVGPTITEKIVYQDKIVEVPGPVVKETVFEEKVVEVIVSPYEENYVEELESENTELRMTRDQLLDEIFDNDGKVEYLTDDLDDDEIMEIVERISFINEIKDLAVDRVKSKLADELDNQDVTLKDGSDIELDEDDIEKIRIDNDKDEVIVSSVDYDDKDAVVEVSGKFKHDDIWFKFVAELEFEEGDFEDFGDISVEEE